MSAKIIEIRVGLPESPDAVQCDLPNKWVATVDSSYRKRVTQESVAVKVDGLEGSRPGCPSHLKFLTHRIILFLNMNTYDLLKLKFPAAIHTLVPGGFGENFLVDHESLRHDVVCVGDIFQINDVILEISGPRAPCPKVDSWHNVTGMTAYVREIGCGGYFARVIQEGSCRAGDEITLLERKHPGYNIHFISSQLWGADDAKFTQFIKDVMDGKIVDEMKIRGVLDNRTSILHYLMNMSELLTRHYRDLAGTKYEKLPTIESLLSHDKSAVTSPASATKESGETPSRQISESKPHYSYVPYILCSLVVCGGIYMYYKRK